MPSVREIALAVHEGQVDKAGVPYREHLLAVEAAVSERAKRVAILHDAWEDGRMTLDEIRALPISVSEYDAILLVSRDEHDTYGSFIGRIARAYGPSGELAREVKIADIRHNLGRLTPGIEADNPGLRSRYEKALSVLLPE